MNKFFRTKFYAANIISNFITEKKNNNIILMYHDIQSECFNNLFTVSEKNFLNQINYINNTNYDVVNIDLNLNKKRNLSITFDDGYINNYYKALPILLNYNLPATIFLTSSKIDKDPKFLTSKHIKEMSNLGINFGIHGHIHQSFTDLNDKELKINILSSKKIIEDIIQKKVEVLSYPNGKFDNRVKEIMNDCNIKFGFCSKSSTYSYDNIDFDLYSIPRVCIWSLDNNFSFKNKLKGKWDYLLKNS